MHRLWKSLQFFQKIHKIFFLINWSHKKIAFEIFWRLRRKSHPSTNVSTNDSTVLQFWLLRCNVIDPHCDWLKKTVRRKETTWSLPKKFIADNSRTSSFEFLVSSTIMVGNKTHLEFQNIAKIELNFYRAKEYLFSNVWSIKNRTSLSNDLLPCLVRFLMHQTLFSFGIWSFSAKTISGFFSAYRSTGFPNVQPITIQHYLALHCDSLNTKKSDAPESWEKLWYRLDLA